MSPRRLNTRLIIAIGAIWFPFAIAALWMEIEKSRELALKEVQRWGTAAGESVRVALNALMREGRMDARFGFYEDLSSELSQIESLRVVRGPRVNEIFERVRRDFDVPREREELLYWRNRAELARARIERASEPDERLDARAALDEAEREIARAERRLRELAEPLDVDPRSVPRDDIERGVLASGEAAVSIERDHMRMVVPYTVRNGGCAEATGCHFNAREGDVLGAVDIVFSIAAVNADLRRSLMTRLGLEVVASLVVLALVYFAVDRIVVRNVIELRRVMERISAGDLGARFSKRRRRTDSGPDRPSDQGDEIDDLVDGFNRMARKLQEDQIELERLATRDGLTGLLNRATFTPTLKSLVQDHLESGRPLSVLMMDLDHFKNTNDAFGHQVGDEALRIASETVRAEMRLDDVVARYGGEEIVAILPETARADAMKLAERIRSALQRRAVDDGRGDVLHVTASIGVAELPADASDVEGLLRAADDALYEAKRLGRNRVCAAGTGSGETSSPTLHPRFT